MKTIKHGEWKLAIDVDKTKQYYAGFVKSDTQANRNFDAYCKTMTVEERSFFDDFGILPEWCNVDSFTWYDDGFFPCGGYFFVCGEFLERPSEVLITAQEYASNIPKPLSDNNIYIGLFKFSFQCNDAVIKNIPKHIPGGFVCVRFFCEDMKWILNEECDYTFENHLKQLNERAIKSEIAEKQRLLDLLNEHNIHFTELDSDKIIEYRNIWLHQYAPEKADFDLIKKDCSFRLWHIFSLGHIGTYCEQNKAAEAFDEVDKSHCILVTNISKNLGFEIFNAGSLTYDMLKNFDAIINDFTVSASDFSWTFSKTHEEQSGIGPFFYKRTD